MKYKILKLLKDKNDFISGEEIGDRFNISRSAVWKYVEKLREEGYNIESVTKKGYLLIDSYNGFNEYEIKNCLKTEFIGKNILFFDKIDSTNDEAKRQALNEAEEGTVITCRNQTNGKGRMGRQWESETGSGLWFSVILKPAISVKNAVQITLLGGIAALRAIRKITGAQAFIKWPNDIVINGKKAVGILKEMSAEIESVKFVVLGIGINVNNDVFEGELAEKATSLKIETKKIYSRNLILCEVLNEFEKLYVKYISKKSFKYFVDEYEKLCINLDRNVKFMCKYYNIEGTAVGIDENGELIIQDYNGAVTSIYSGEVSVRNSDGKYI